MRKYLITFILLFSLSNIIFANVTLAKAKGDKNDILNSLHFSISIQPEENHFTIQFYLKNKSNQPIKLEFPTSQNFEWVVKNEIGREVYRYSIGKAFLQAIQEKKIKPKETLKWEDQWDYQINGKLLEKGIYTVEGWLTVTKVNKKTVGPKVFFDKKTMERRNKSVNFQDLHVEGKEGNYLVTGKSIFNHFYYTVDDGHNYLLDEQQVTVSYSQQEMPIPFNIHIQIPKEKLPKNGAIVLTLYRRNYQDGSIVDEHSILLEQFAEKSRNG